ncbi:MAG TPA: DUF2934 domain-containing protein [Rhodopila sp.]|uniref:DUF2934 domain-containing protein n=1 Tax=Rhodopila sp. TaxID=2480087 RepID=UPI002B693C26|nr:DUF2934 domain-containing protein [Rhodopila sp.]HVY14105.1 DUF2934 domain-containing protein [Rhodopila sp.]
MNLQDQSVSTDDAVHKLIAERAYEIWESHGRIHGYDKVHWHEAEQEILNCLQQAAEVQSLKAPHAA